MLEVNNKFNIGEECWTMFRKPIEYKCPVCDGNGKFKHNGYDIHCNNCRGTGILHNSKQNILEVCKVKVRRIKVTIWKNDYSVKYVVDPIEPKFISVRNRRENILFKTKEEVEKYVKEVNTKEIVGEF